MAATSAFNFGACNNLQLLGIKYWRLLLIFLIRDFFSLFSLGLPFFRRGNLSRILDRKSGVSKIDSPRAARSDGSKDGSVRVAAWARSAGWVRVTESKVLSFQE